MACGGALQVGWEFVVTHTLERLHSRIGHALSCNPIDLDYLNFVCTQEVVFISALGNNVQIPQDILDALTTLHNLLDSCNRYQRQQYVAPAVQTGRPGRPRIQIPDERILHLLQRGYSVAGMARLMGISRATIFRRLKRLQLSVKGLYSTLTDEELDAKVSEIKSRMPNAGYRMVRGNLQAMGHRVQWDRVRASMHRVDTVGLLSRLTQLGCVVRRTYSVPCPKYMVHIDTCHKLVRYSLIMHGGIDGFSRKASLYVDESNTKDLQRKQELFWGVPFRQIMYLGAATNNLAETTLGFFMESVERFGYPLRVRADQGVENVDVARLMLFTRGPDTGCFISGKSVHNQRIERLWRDVWDGVTSMYYTVLHTLEEGGFLDLSSSLDLFCCHYVFQPRLQASLDGFRETWDNHPLRTERNMTPNQLWEMGQELYPIADPDNLQIGIPEIDWEDSGYAVDTNAGVIIPTLDSPLTEQQMEDLKNAIDPLGPSESFGFDVYLNVRQHVLTVLM